MLKKVIDNLGYAGLVALFGALFYYSVFKQWDWKAMTLVWGGTALLLVGMIANLPRIRAALKTRAARYGGMAGLTVVLVGGILILVNFMNFRHHRRIDLTEGGLYSLSDQTRKVLENLESDVEIIGFFRTEPGRVGFQETMNEYRYLSSRVNFEVVDPEEDPGKTTQYEIQRNGQVVVESGPKRERLDDYDEEKITNALIKVTRKEEKTVYFLQGHGERNLEEGEAQGFSAVRDAVQKQNYQVKPYNLAQENQLPQDATVIVSAGPKVDFFPNEVNLLKEYLASGGKLLLLADPDSEFEMSDFLGQYGINLSKKVVIDASGLGQLFGLGAAAPMVSQYADHPVTRELAGVMTFYPLAQYVATTDSPLGYQTVGLAETSQRSWAESNLQGGRAAFDENEDLSGPLNLAVAATLEIREAETESDAAAANGEEEEGEAEEQAEEEVEEEAAPSPAKEARLVVYGDSDFASNGYFNGGANGDLLLMTISWLAEETDLIAVRPKSPENRRIEATVAQSRFIFWGVVIFLPLMTLISGIIVWHRRR